MGLISKNNNTINDKAMIINVIVVLLNDFDNETIATNTIIGTAEFIPLKAALTYTLFLNFIRYIATISIIINDGKIAPKRVTIAPTTPYILYPTIVEQFTAKAPGKL